MSRIYLLFSDTDEHGVFDVVGWSASKETLDREALKLEWADFRADLAKPWPFGFEPRSPDETDYRKYFVKGVEEIS